MIELRVFEHHNVPPDWTLPPAFAHWTPVEWVRGVDRDDKTRDVIVLSYQELVIGVEKDTGIVLTVYP